MSESVAPARESSSDTSPPAGLPLRVGCVVRARSGQVGRVIEIGHRDFWIRSREGAKKQYLLSFLNKFTTVEDVPRKGRDGRFFQRLSQPRPTECESCGRELTDLVSIAIGVGPICRAPRRDLHHVRSNELREAWINEEVDGDSKAAAAAFDAMQSDEEAAKFLIWTYGLDG